MTKIAIAIVTDAWTPQINGVVNTLNNTVNELRSRSFEVMTVTPDMFWSISVSKVEGLNFALPPYRMHRFLKDADYIHIATEGLLGLAATWYCVKNNLKYTTAFHTNFPKYMKDVYGINEKYSVKFLRWFHSKSQAILVPTKSMINDLENLGFENCQLWGRGVDRTIFNTIDEPSKEDFGHRPYWLNVGRVSKEKNIEAFLNLDLPGTKIIVGDGPDMIRLKTLYPDAKFLGMKKGKELASIYRAADVFCFSSIFDTFGLVNIEAISCGTPVAAFPVTGPIDIIKQGVTGYLDNDLREACLKALEIGRVNDNFSWSKATDQFLNHLVLCK